MTSARRLTRAGVDVTRDWLAFAASPSLSSSYSSAASLPDELPSGYAATVLAPLAAIIEAVEARVVAVAGPAGGGKTTLSRALSDVFSSAGKSVLAASLDDFYFSRAKRTELGFEFRAAPGSHDVDALRTLLAQARAGSLPLVVPRFDAGADDRGTPETVETTPDLVIIDGWLIGLGTMGYETLLPEIDLIVHLHIPEDVARERRLSREQALRERTGRGYSPAQMERFWHEVLGPGGRSWVADAEDHADLILSLDSEGELERALLTEELLEHTAASSGCERSAD